MKLRSLALSIFAFALAFASQAAAERIISLAGEVTEIVYALDAQDQLVAVDATSVYPAAANDLPNVSYYGRLQAETLSAKLGAELGFSGDAMTELVDYLYSLQ